MQSTRQWLSRVDPSRWTCPFIVGAVLLLSIYLGHAASLAWLVLGVAFVGGLILFRYPELGIVTLLVGALLFPFSLGTGTQTRLHAGILLIPILAAVWVLKALPNKRQLVAHSSINLPALLFAVSATFSLAVGNLPWNYFAEKASVPSQLGEWSVFVLSALLLVWVGNQIRNLQWISATTWLFLAIGCIYVIGRLLPPIGRFTEGLLVDPVQRESLFWVWLVALAAGQSMFNQALTLQLRLGLLLLALVTLGVGWFQGKAWVSGWLPPLVGFLSLVWLYSWRLGLSLSMCGGLVLLVRDPGLLTSLVTLKQYSIDTRFMAWDILLRDIIPISPILGLGPANYYFYTPLFSIAGYYVNFNSHNQYVDILAQMGIVGLVTFGILIIAIARLAWRLRVTAKFGFERAYVYACLGGLAGTLWAGLHGDWFLPFVYNIGLAGFRASLLGWLFLGGLVAIEHAVSHRRVASTLSD